MTRDIRLMRMTIEELFVQYEHECCKINYEDKQMAKKAIRNELQSRMDQTLRLLETNETVNIKEVFRNFNQPAEKRK